MLYVNDRLSKNYGNMLMWIKVCLAFAVVQVTSVCFHGSRVRWQSGTSTDDGAHPL